MNVFYFSSDLFVKVLATSMISLLENNRNEHIDIFICNDGITKEKQKSLVEMVNRYDASLFFVEAPDPSQAFGFPFKDKYQMGHSYPRMLLGSLLPENVSRVLCLDSDTLILHNLHEFYYQDMEDNILAGVQDCMNLKAYRKKFHLTEDQIYCNAGMFLVNLDEWRNQNIEKEISDIIKNNNGNIFFFEQTLMSYSCRDKIKKLPPKYNVYTLFYAFRYKNLLRWRKPTHFYSEAEIQEAVKDPYIIHFTRNFYMLSRPWTQGCNHPLTEIYRTYMVKTPWPETEPDNRRKLSKLKFKLWHVIPQGFLCLIVSFIYNVVRPRIWWKNE